MPALLARRPPSTRPRRPCGQRRWGWAAAALVALTAAGVWVIEGVLPFAIIRPSRDEARRVYRGQTPATHGLAASEFWTEAAPGVALKGWIVQAKTPGPARGTLVLLHGSSSCKEAMLGSARGFAGMGFRCVVYDSRAHGESGGEFATFGFYERRDFSRVLDEVQRQVGDLGPVGVFGSSYGAAVALQAMAEDARVRAAVVECPFATLRETVRDYQARMLGVPWVWVANLALDRAGRLARFNPDAVSPEAAAGRIHGPVLLIHGVADERVSVRYGERIFQKLRTGSPGSEWYPVAGAGHDGLWQSGGAEYRERVRGFLERQLGSDAGSTEGPPAGERTTSSRPDGLVHP